MKKSLLALAAMGAFAGAAQAQSSVTVYGILDVGFSGSSTRGASSAFSTGAPVTSAINNTKVNTTSFNGGNLATNRLGFRGTEDLGGGLSAFFTAEMQLAPTESNSFTNMTNRQSFVGLAKKGLGNAAIGTQYTPIFNSMTMTNPGANNNVVGSIIYPLTNANATNSEALTVRRNNALTFTTERMAGFRLQGMYFANNSDTTQGTAAGTYSIVQPGATTGTPGQIAQGASTITGGNLNSFGYGIAADYTWQKLLVTAAFHQNKAETTATPVNRSTAAGLAGNLTDNQVYAAAMYDFGILKAYVNWIDRKITSATNSNDYVKRTGQQIGVRGDLTKTITGWANIGNGRYDSFGPGSPTANFNAWQLGTQYNMSKRTALYAIYGQSQTSSTTNTAGLTTSAAASQYAIGARHTF